MTTWILKPAPGLNVRKLDGSLLKSDGEPVPVNSYYQRRVAEGAAVEVKPTKKTKRD